MDTKIENLLESVAGKTVAIIYIFEKDGAKGYSHYEAWKSDVISSWLIAVQELKCVPYIMDARTFVYKAMNDSLPIIDYVVNLNNGNNELSTLGLIPSVCSFLGLSCIPCDTLSMIIGENKQVSNLIAYAKNMNIPKELNISTPNGITRPIGLGSSFGVKRGVGTNNGNDFIYQEFIQGVDMTIPILYNPISNELEVLPAIMYHPDSNDVNWFLGEKEKGQHCGYLKKAVRIDDEAKEKCLRLAQSFSISTYCRIDTRVKCDSIPELEEITKGNIPYNRIYFLEINPTPTIKNNINFHTSLESLIESDKISNCLNEYRKHIKDYTYTGFVLFCSMVSIFITKRLK